MSGTDDTGDTASNAIVATVDHFTRERAKLKREIELKDGVIRQMAGHAAEQKKEIDELKLMLDTEREQAVRFADAMIQTRKDLEAERQRVEQLERTVFELTTLRKATGPDDPAAAE